MSIHHAMLGVLSYASLTGYDLKKIMQGSCFMYWSGNNNQIYKALVDLLDKGYVTNEVLHQSSSPSKKVYTITKSGLDELKRWTKEQPEAPEIKKPFLIQLAWSAQLSNAQIRAMLDEYERAVSDQIAMAKAKTAKKQFSPDRTEREAAIWRSIDDSVMESYEAELQWIEGLRQTLSGFRDEDYQQEGSMSNTNNHDNEPNHYMVVGQDEQRYLLLDAVGTPIDSEQAAVDLVALCVQNGCNCILLPGERITDDFLRLRTGIAGRVLEKFATYRIRVACVMRNGRIKGKFEDFALESNRGNVFRIYETIEDAEGWLLR